VLAILSPSSRDPRVVFEDFDHGFMNKWVIAHDVHIPGRPAYMRIVDGFDGSTYDARFGWSAGGEEHTYRLGYDK